MGKFSDLEKILKDLDDKYIPKWEAEKKLSESKDSDTKPESKKGEKDA